MDHLIPLSIPNFEGNEEKYVSQAVEQGWVSTGGAFIDQFENFCMAIGFHVLNLL